MSKDYYHDQGQRMFAEYFAEKRDNKREELTPEALELMRRANEKGKDDPRYLKERERLGLNGTGK